MFSLTFIVFIQDTHVHLSSTTRLILTCLVIRVLYQILVLACEGNASVVNKIKAVKQWSLQAINTHLKTKDNAYKWLLRHDMDKRRDKRTCAMLSSVFATTHRTSKEILRYIFIAWFASFQCYITITNICIVHALNSIRDINCQKSVKALQAECPCALNSHVIKRIVHSKAFFNTNIYETRPGNVFLSQRLSLHSFHKSWY